MGTDSGKLKLNLAGRGKMGRAVEKALLLRGHTLVPLEEAELCIDFSRSETVLENVKKCAALGKGCVIGTTGWEKERDSVFAAAEKGGIGLLYSANFSIGIALFKELLSQAAELLAEYDVGGIEAHHNEKADIPSGTAREIGELLLKTRKDKERVLFGNSAPSDPKKEIHFPSLRCGGLFGTHTLHFDGEHDSITLSHSAKGREGFAEGAVDAAEWLKGKTGIYTLEDMLRDSLHRSRHSL